MSALHTAVDRAIALRGELARTLQPMIPGKDYTDAENMVRVLMPLVERSLEGERVLVLAEARRSIEALPAITSDYDGSEGRLLAEAVAAIEALGMDDA